MEQLTQIVTGLEEVKKSVVDTLNQTGHSMLAINANIVLSRLINMINQATGNVSPSSKREGRKFEPVTNFMGEPLSLPKEVKPEDLSPAEFRKQQFVKQVDELEASFLDRTDENIMEAHPLADHQLAIRAVAKRAGLEDYRSATINLEYIQKIREKIELNKEEEKEIEKKSKVTVAKDELE